MSQAAQAAPIARRFEAPLPLSLYVHIPWCVRKCPYCDFNSHPLRGDIDASGYVRALLSDLDADLRWVQGRAIQSIFIGGGTPSLLPGEAIAALLAGIRARLECVPDLEVTLEANPGAADAERFAHYRASGVNRLSIGVQSFDDGALRRIGRIHDSAGAVAALQAAHDAGFDNLNLDLMFGLPGQSAAQAEGDLERAIASAPSHISYYQLTLEPNTAFHANPPPVPQDEVLWRMQEAGQGLLDQAGYVQYEISAYARDGHECLHNRNYWEFGDYLGIGAGAHGKLTDRSTGEIWRFWKHKHPRTYREQAGGFLAGRESLGPHTTALDFMLNTMRLQHGVPVDLFGERTGLPWEFIELAVAEVVQSGLLSLTNGWIRPTPLGRRYLNNLLEPFAT